MPSRNKTSKIPDTYNSITRTPCLEMLTAEIESSIKLSAIRKIEDLRQPDLAMHEHKVASLCEILCKTVGIDDLFIEPLKLAARLHDLGKLGISDELLNKPSPLTDREMQVMKTHSALGYEILSGSGDTVLNFAANISLSHHECFDGSGYPLGLRREAIPLCGRIVALCDVYDALRADRSYRSGMSHDQTLAVITAKTGRASRRTFDPVLLRAFVNSTDAVLQVYQPSADCIKQS